LEVPVLAPTPASATAHLEAASELGKGPESATS
jgi:hypothetical protein